MELDDVTREDWTLIFVRELRQAPAAVWAALTVPEELDQWAPFTAARSLDSPGETVLTLVDGPDRTDIATEVVRAEAPVLLEYTWGDDRLRWELEPSGAGTRLTLRHTPARPGTEAMLAAGWHLCLRVLRHLLDGEPIGVIRGRDAMNHGWEELRAGYAAKLGPGDVAVRGLRRVIVSVADLGPALGLYRDVLGFREKYRTDEVVMLGAAFGDLELLLHRRPPTPGLAGVTISYLVDDVDAVTAAAEKAGASVVDAPADQPWGERQAVLTDPDGHVFCLVAPKVD